MFSKALIFKYIGLLIVLTLLYISDAAEFVLPKFFFDIQKFGAIADGKTDSSKAFLEAWKEACNCNGRCWILVPKGIYMLSSAVFVGPCRGITGLLVQGKILAPADPAQFLDHWITFRYVDQLVVKGTGILDGQGSSAWPFNECKTNPNCKPLPATMRFDFITNSKINHVNSVNSKNAHFNLFACNNININKVKLTAPADSPNTDGIRIGGSKNIKISRSIIATGDDCISIVGGTHNVEISEVSCGPGHGISIGSLGKSEHEHVHDVKVLNSNFTRTQIGLRVKTWAPSLSGIVSNLTFQDISMNEVNNPIIIDQHYCPTPPCDNQAQSGVKISNVTYQNIRGTSSSQTAVNIKCSKIQPCHNVTLDTINLTYNGRGGSANSSCSNIDGKALGIQMPPGCL